MIVLPILMLVSLNYAETYKTAITDKFVHTQSSQWLEPHDETFLPYNVRSDITNIKITKIEEMVKYFWEGENDTGSLIDHFHNLVSVVKVTYQGTCLNKLVYEGVEYLFSEAHQLNEAWASHSESEKFKSHAHEFVNKPLDYISEDGTYYDKLYPEFSTYTKFDKNIIAQRWKSKKVNYPEWKYMGVPGKRMASPILFDEKKYCAGVLLKDTVFSVDECFQDGIFFKKRTRSYRFLVVIRNNERYTFCRPHC